VRTRFLAVMGITTPKKGTFMKKSVAVVTGAVLALGMAGPAFADAGAQGGAANSPGLASGNVIEAPVHVPVNVCGDTIDIIALLNPAFGAACGND
jgi:hypothetical protein